MALPQDIRATRRVLLLRVMGRLRAIRLQGTRAIRLRATRLRATRLRATRLRLLTQFPEPKTRGRCNGQSGQPRLLAPVCNSVFARG
jgi:hypothetical protein